MSDPLASTISPAWKPAAVVFDCDGLLVDTEGCWSVAEGEIFARSGLSFGPPQKAQLIGKSVTDEAREIAKAVGGNSNARDIEIELLDLAFKAIDAGARAMPGAVSIVERMGQVLPIAVASNSPRRLLDMALQRGELAHAFRVTVAGDEVRAPKPAPDVYLEACRRLGVAPEHALAFEDSMTGVLAAKAAGMKVICIPTLKGLAYPADAVFDSLGDRRLLEWLGTWMLALAAEHLRSGNPAEAIGPLVEAARLRPANALILHDLGLAYLEVGQISNAITALQGAAAGNPGDADTQFRLGIALETAGEIAGAIVAYDRATELDPSLTEAWFRAGALVYTLGHRDEAIGCFRRAAATGPKTTFGRLGKARALLTEDRDEEAERVLRRTLSQDPSNAMAHDLLGNLLAEFGRFDEAHECLQRAIALAPLLAGSYYDLVRCRAVTHDDGLIQKMTAALATPKLESAQCLRLHLAIGKAADDLGDYALAMKHFDAADGVRRGPKSFDSAAFAHEIDRLIARFTPEMSASAPDLGVNDATPVLIIGMPRSGTTLVEQIISSHPEVGAGGELNFWNERGAQWHRAGAGGSERPFISSAAADYLEVLRGIAPRAKRVTDKMPFNFLWAGLIHLAFPRAVIIHCRRNPLDTALSIHQTHFHPSLAFPTGGAELVAYFRSYQRLTDHWRRVLPVDRYVEVNYEELTREPEAGIRRIIASCGLQWHDACLHPEKNPRVVKTPSKWQTRQPIYRNSVARWKRYEPWLGPLRSLLNEEV